MNILNLGIISSLTNSGKWKIYSYSIIIHIKRKVKIINIPFWIKRSNLSNEIIKFLNDISEGKVK